MEWTCARSGAGRRARQAITCARHIDDEAEIGRRGDVGNVGPKGIAAAPRWQYGISANVAAEPQ